MAFKVPESLRTHGDAGNLQGAFILLGRSNRDRLVIIASNGMGWEHVSVSKKYETPTWDEMCKVKDLFWDSEDCVIQYHPPGGDYVNNHPFCLHIWRPVDQEIPRPPTILVGF